MKILILIDHASTVNASFLLVPDGYDRKRVLQEANSDGYKIPDIAFETHVNEGCLPEQVVLDCYRRYER